MNSYLYSLVVIALVILEGGTLVAWLWDNRQHRQERERYVRALIAKNVPEFATLEKIIEGDQSKIERRLRAVGSREQDPRNDPDIPRVPEGL